jgi:signal transduction histidine kinase
MDHAGADGPHTHTVLIVDDLPINVAVVAPHLEANAISVLVAHNGVDALCKAQLTHPDLILLDVKMPDMDGFETCRRLKVDTRTRDIPIIFMTARAACEDIVQGLLAGGVDYITKPIHIPEFLARVSNHLAVHSLHRQLSERNTTLQREMLVRLQAESALQRAHDELEDRVAQRTAELAKTNERLQFENLERKQIESQLRGSEARLANAQRLAHLGDWEWDSTAARLYWSEEALSVARMSHAASGPGWPQALRIVHREDRMTVLRAVRDLIRRGAPYCIDCRIVVSKGHLRTIQAQGEVKYSNDGQALGIVGTIQDITERKSIEQELLASREQLREASAYLEAAREEERRFIAREIHDDLGQALTALKLDIALLRKRLADDAFCSSKLAAMHGLVERTVWMVRNVASQLRPAALNFGIVSALEWLTDEFNQHNATVCQFHLRGNEPNLSDTEATAVFRIAQESLTNVARHAGATKVNVTLVTSDSRVSLLVSDDGRGLATDIVQKRRSFGLLGMEERARLIGASLQIATAHGGGTVISVDLALKGRGAS